MKSDFTHLPSTCRTGWSQDRGIEDRFSGACTEIGEPEIFRSGLASAREVIRSGPASARELIL